MGEIAGYIYNYVPVFLALAAIVGALVVAIEPSQLRHIRTWYAIGGLSVFAIPITFAATSTLSTPVVLIIAGASAFLFGTVYYGGLWFLEERIQRVEQRSQDSDPEVS